jgi:hypothetical protein
MQWPLESQLGHFRLNGYRPSLPPIAKTLQNANKENLIKMFGNNVAQKYVW